MTSPGRSALKAAVVRPPPHVHECMPLTRVVRGKIGRGPADLPAAAGLEVSAAAKLALQRALRRRRYCASRRRTSPARPAPAEPRGSASMKKAWINYWVDMVTGGAFLLCVVTGVVFLFFPGLTRTSGGEATILGVSSAAWHWVHDWSGVVMTAGVGVHTALHLRWLVTMTRKLSRDERAAGAPGRSRERARIVSPGAAPVGAAAGAVAARRRSGCRGRVRCPPVAATSRRGAAVSRGDAGTAAAPGRRAPGGGAALRPQGLPGRRGRRRRSRAARRCRPDEPRRVHDDGHPVERQRRRGRQLVPGLRAGRRLVEQLVGRSVRQS